VFEENAPEFGGLYILELADGGAAASSGALEPNDQLVSIGGQAATGPVANFDAVMDALGASASPAKLRFFRGSAAALAAAVSAPAPAAPLAAAKKPTRTDVVVVQAGLENKDVVVSGEKLLRNALLENKVIQSVGSAKKKTRSNACVPLVPAVHLGVLCITSAACIELGGAVRRHGQADQLWRRGAVWHMHGERTAGRPRASSLSHSPGCLPRPLKVWHLGSHFMFCFAFSKEPAFCVALSAQVNVVDSADGLANGAFSAKTAAEGQKLKKRPASVRLACQVVCQGGEATVSTKP
jgi:hypothetical protein